MAQLGGEFCQTLEDIEKLILQTKMLGFAELSKIVRLALFDHWWLDIQPWMFKLCTKSNSMVAMESPFDFNPFTQISKMVDASSVMTHSFFEYIKLARWL